MSRSRPRGRRTCKRRAKSSQRSRKWWRRRRKVTTRRNRPRQRTHKRRSKNSQRSRKWPRTKNKVRRSRKRPRKVVAVTKKLRAPVPPPKRRTNQPLPHSRTQLPPLLRAALRKLPLQIARRAATVS
ncbi:unnamed protein product [Heterosigma akashiwo]